MPGRQDEVTKWWFFDTVAEFWEAPILKERIGTIENGSFWGNLKKGIVKDGELRDATLEDGQQGLICNVIIVNQVLNHERTWNWNCLSDPPIRTGYFEWFMDEVEAVAERFGIEYVLVERVANEFLPSKLERRGYRRLSGELPNPDYLKQMI